MARYLRVDGAACGPVEVTPVPDHPNLFYVAYSDATSPDDPRLPPIARYSDLLEITRTTLIEFGPRRWYAVIWLSDRRCVCSPELTHQQAQDWAHAHGSQQWDVLADNN